MPYNIHLTEAERQWPMGSTQDIGNIIKSILSRELKVSALKLPAREAALGFKPTKEKRAVTLQLGEGPFDGSTEHFWTLGFDIDKQLTFVDLVAIGNLLTVNVNPRMAYRGFAYYAAAYAVFVHNHVSDQPPVFSEADKETTITLLRTSKLAGVRVYDHMAINNKLDIISMLDQNILAGLAEEADFTDLTMKAAAKAATEMNNINRQLVTNLNQRDEEIKDKNSYISQLEAELAKFKK
ncbi:MAG: hypothetical protein FWE37_00575 [Spirochaetaceae bacterium]|nr:hypothetical protein [Spirochaetaceae bacterium]